MLERTYRTPLPLTLEVAVPAGRIEVETAEGEETSLAVDGDERLLREVEIRQDGDHVVVAYRGRGRFGFSRSPLALVFGADGLRVRATIPHEARLEVKTASADLEIAGTLGSLEVSSVSGDLRLRGEIAGDAVVKTVSGGVRLGGAGGVLTARTVSGDRRIVPVAGSAETKTVSGDVRIE